MENEKKIRAWNCWDESNKNKMAAAAIKKNDILSEFRLFFTDMTYVPGQFIPYIFFGTKP